MAGVAFEADFSVAARALDRLTEDQLAIVADKIAEMMEGQTTIRIMDEKTAPDGTPWAPWSEAYAKTRNKRGIEFQTLLVGEGNPGLLESIQNYSTGLTAVVGTNQPYGATHQFGSANGATPARPYLGLSADNRAEIEALVIGNLEDLLQ